MRADVNVAIARIVGARLKQLRLDAELTQQQIAARTALSRPVVGRIERGVHEPSLDVVNRYAAALDLDLATVLVCLDVEWLEAGHAARRAA